MVFVTDLSSLILDINGYFTSSAWPAGRPARETCIQHATGCDRVERESRDSSERPSIFAEHDGGSGRSAERHHDMAHRTTAAARIDPERTHRGHHGQGRRRAVRVYSTDNTDLVVGINCYFAAPGAGGLTYRTLVPCRVADTRHAADVLGGPDMGALQTRTFPLLASNCGIPAGAQAYSLNATVVPKTILGYLTMWPAGLPRPLVSTLNADSSVVANAVIVRAGVNGGISVYTTHLTSLILDINGYFMPWSSEALTEGGPWDRRGYMARSRPGHGPVSTPQISRVQGYPHGIQPGRSRGSPK